MTILDRDERFAAALEECRRRVGRGELLESCVADYPREYREELTDLVTLGGRLGGLASDPSPEFQSKLERRLLASFSTAEKEKDVARHAQGGELAAHFGPIFAAVSLRVATAALVVAIVIGGSGAVQASANSLPDEPLYQVKVAREWVELALARDEESRLDFQARQMGERSSELERALQAGRAHRVAETLARRFAQSARRAVDQALEARVQGNPRPAMRALVAIRAAERRLDLMSSQASPAVLPYIQQMRAFLDRQEQRLLERGAPAGGRFDARGLRSE